MADSRKGIDIATYTSRGSVANSTFVRRDDDSADTTAPTISNIGAVEITRAYVKLEWDTDEPANCQVSYSTNADMSSATEGDTHAHYVTSGREYLIGSLSAGTQYYFQITSADRAGNSTTTATYTFTTASDGDGGSVPTVA